MKMFEAKDEAYKTYTELIEKIKKMYNESNEYPIFQKSSEELLLQNTEEYIHELFNNIAFSQGKMGREEKEFIEKLKICDEKSELQTDKDRIIESVTNSIPEYLKLAKSVDSYTNNTRYAMELLSYTEEIFRLLQSADGSISREEVEFVNPVMSKLRTYIKE